MKAQIENSSSDSVSQFPQLPLNRTPPLAASQVAKVWRKLRNLPSGNLLAGEVCLPGKFACRDAKVWRRGEGGEGEIYSGASLRQDLPEVSGIRFLEVDRNFFVC
ncbi:hypothetical protein BDZ91DRAFT_292155 [Kalaharituber pfeilii]|nr:hypothetical protein BDZ91DRAFT_292155 [Kalaharituber pfeilii]